MMDLSMDVHVDGISVVKSPEFLFFFSFFSIVLRAHRIRLSRRPSGQQTRIEPSRHDIFYFFTMYRHWTEYVRLSLDEWMIGSGAGKGLCKMKDRILLGKRKGRQKQVGESHASLYFYRGILNSWYCLFISHHVTQTTEKISTDVWVLWRQSADLRGSESFREWKKKLIILFWSWVGRRLLLLDACHAGIIFNSTTLLS